jgi:hypothetical protein
MDSCKIVIEIPDLIAGYNVNCQIKVREFYRKTILIQFKDMKSRWKSQ